MKEQDSDKPVDLHLHTCYSDGSDTPELVVKRAVEAGLSAIAITDHDTIEGIQEGKIASKNSGLDFLPGVEISCEFKKTEIHVVGLGIDPNCEELLSTLNRMREMRATRARKILVRLRDLGLPVEYNETELFSNRNGTIGRMHIARQIVDCGYASSIQEAFDKFLNPGRPAYISREKLSCEKAIAVIHEAKGLAFLGHPGIGNITSLLGELTRLPFDGLEAYHVKHSPGQIEQFLRLASELGWLVSGGSDCHGNAKTSPEMGKIRIPRKIYNRIYEKLAIQQIVI